MSVPRIVFSTLALGGLLTVIALASNRRAARRDFTRAAPRLGPLVAPPKPNEPPQSVVAPPDLVLPLAFWDAAAELEPEDELPLASHALGLSDEPYDSIALEDASATWLARATQAPRTSGSAIDDPAEIAADSMSMVSEASRNAATHPSLRDESGPESSG